MAKREYEDDYEWDDEGLLEDDFDVETFLAKQSRRDARRRRGRKRPAWSQIEEARESRRLRDDLADFDDYL
jgi:hypothetical protein